MAITGRFVLLAFAALAPLVLFPAWTTVLLVTGALLLFLVIDLVLAASPAKVTLERRQPPNVTLESSVTATLTVTNGSRRRLRAVVRDAWQPSAGAAYAVQSLAVPPAERRRMSVTLCPSRRGDLESPHVTIRSLGPLGLAARQRTRPLPGKLRVLPPFHSKRHLPSKLRKLRELDGRAAVQIRGAGTEFDSLRDYVRGDDVRSIDWRATARRTSVVVRTWRPERDRRVVIVLDTSRTAAARIADEPRLDTGIEAALLLAVLAERGGDRVDFLAYDRRLRARVESASKGNLLGQLVQAMAPLDAELIELDWQQIPGQVRAVSAHRSLVVLLTALDGGAPEEGLLPLVARLATQHVVVVASVRDPLLDAMKEERTTASQVFRAAAAERALLERAAVSNQLRQLGAEVVDAHPLELPPMLADAYIRLKAAGRL
ncbi:MULTISPECIES: DUF58 domain-containing protein [Paenarthrobacter]|uniref:DUF58 domain-containing protein n=1 Tax=Paenarthrobacter TaxID=1742992 RepID=UPI00074D445C|nr:DUF58 domain-containing protein [Paenarthrobacter ureafaciens]AMB41070.1 hypothetical protein AUT26_13305 [Arthrobacter sp. ATCC 21022]KUR66043.1 hypothetical protein JM67_01205 [Arthrobacter sp. ATCC 21022]RWW99428.1 DUF58 domain-containing protein [Paenarthrobacter ureafaciens]BCW84930.1 lipoprotein [Arthrobacter sp. NicSoilE8]